MTGTLHISTMKVMDYNRFYYCRCNYSGIFIMSDVLSALKNHFVGYNYNGSLVTNIILDEPISNTNFFFFNIIL